MPNRHMAGATRPQNTMFSQLGICYNLHVIGEEFEEWLDIFPLELTVPTTGTGHEKGVVGVVYDSIVEPKS